MANRNLYRICLLTALFIVALSVATACTQEAEPMPTPPQPTATPTNTPTPSPTSTPTFTPTPAPLSPAQIFDEMSPVVAYVDTPAGTGSGVLIAENYLLTNAHVVWPYEAVRVVFADGEEFLDAPVMNVDLMVDLAIVGPLETEKTGVPLVNGEDLVIGADVYLIGYPGEVSDFPQPTITRGLISRLRQWDALEITYFQSDATIGSGQSGGVLVSEMGDVIGISGFYFSEAAFALVASAHDLLPRVETLIAGESIDQIGDWHLPLDKPGRAADFVTLTGYWDHAIFLINEPAKTNLEVELSGDEDGILTVFDLFGYPIIYADESFSGTEFGQETTELEAPHFVMIEQDSFGTAYLRLESNLQMIPYQETIENRRVASGDEIWSKIDFPGDYDVFKISLNKGQTINIQADSVLIDPYISIVPDRAFRDEEMVTDDDSGQGIFGFNAELTYEAPESGRYNILVSDALGHGIGGYILTVGQPYEGAPTPVALPPTPTPIASEFGDLTEFVDPRTGFKMMYPQDWTDAPSASVFRETCNNVTACFSYRDTNLLFILIEDLSEFGLADLSLDDYVAQIKNRQQGNSLFSLIKDEPLITESGLQGHLLGYNIQDGIFANYQALFIEDNSAFTITYLIPSELVEELEPLLLYSLRSIDVR